MRLNWTFTDDSTVEFTFKFNAKEAADYGWWGFGLKEDDQGFDMSGSDLFIIRKDGGTLEDYYASDNELPPLDTSASGTNNLSLISHSEDTEYYTTVFSRKLSTGDPNDIVLRKGARYIVLYAYGEVLEGVLQEEDSDHNGGERLVLQEDYDDDDEDDDSQSDKYSTVLVSLAWIYAVILLFT